MIFPRLGPFLGCHFSFFGHVDATPHAEGGGEGGWELVTGQKLETVCLSTHKVSLSDNEIWYFPPLEVELWGAQGSAQGSECTWLVMTSSYKVHMGHDSDTLIGHIAEYRSTFPSP